jgi:predicted ATP-binding protein involved in virulence
MMKTNLKPIQSAIDYDWGIVSLQNAKENGYREGSKQETPANDGQEGISISDGKGGKKFVPYKDEAEKEYYKHQPICQSQYTTAMIDYAGTISQDEDKKLSETRTVAKSQAKTDSHVLEATAKWGACMKEAGFDFKTPQDASSFEWTRPQGDPDEKEKKTAVKDFECKKSTNLMTTWYDVLHEKESGLIDQYRPILEKSKNQEKKWVEFAQKVIANGGTSLDVH